MSACSICGGAIEFRYMSGRRIPIHTDGYGCSGYRNGASAAYSKPFGTSISYLNPNAHCPVCNKPVFFYQSAHGGRVFFDNVGWPWPKHGCTDNPLSQSGTIRPFATRNERPFISASGEPLDLYELVSRKQDPNFVHIRLSKVGENRSFSSSVPRSQFHERDIKLTDLDAAPSFVVRTYKTHREIDFISGRKKRIETIIAPRPLSQE